MDKIFNQAKDKNVAAVIVYKKTSDVYAYADSAKSVKISADVLADMFTKGMFVIDGANTYAPVALSIDDDDVATITYVTTDTTTATTAVLATLVSEEYTAG